MAESQRRRLRAPARRSMIESAAAQLFAERGYGGTRLEDVAAAAHVTKPVLYRHFSSKKELYLGLLEGHQERQAHFVARALESASGGNPLDVVLDRWFAEVRQRPQTWLMIFADNSGDAEIRAARRGVQGDARVGIAAFLAAQSGTRTTAPEVEPMAELLRSAMAGLALWSLEHPEVPRALLVDLTRRAIGGLLTTMVDKSN